MSDFGVWKKSAGKCIATDKLLPGMPKAWADYEDLKKYYGGIPICESIPTEELRNLLLAAPDLLEALKRAKKTIQVFHSQEGKAAGWTEEERASVWKIYNEKAPEMKAINAAIAKAEGEGHDD